MRAILLQPPPGRRHQWPVMTLIIVGALGSLLFRTVVDVPPIQAPPDLDPPEPVFSGQWRDTVATNGWAYLGVALEVDAIRQQEEDQAARAAPASGPTWRRAAYSPRTNPLEALRDILSKKSPWDEAVIEKFRRGGAMIWNVEQALRKPEFRPGVSPPFTQLWRWVVIQVEADFAHALHEGDLNRARRCVSGLVRLSALILRESRLSEDYDLAQDQRRAAARMTFQLLSADPENRTAAASLLEDWLTEAPETEAAVRGLVRSTLDRRRLTNWTWKESRSHPGLRARPNRTARLFMAEARRIQETGFPPVATNPESPAWRAYASYIVPFPWLLAMDSNREGLASSLPAWAADYAQEDYFTVRGNLFVTRAMRASLAVWLWRLDHGGALPATLTELTPTYLKTAQEDPWTGDPLGWNPVNGVISAAGGTNWDARAPASAISPGGMDMHRSPARARLPDNSPPPPPPAPSP